MGSTTTTTGGIDASQELAAYHYHREGGISSDDVLISLYGIWRRFHHMGAPGALLLK